MAACILNDDQPDPKISRVKILSDTSSMSAVMRLVTGGDWALTPRIGVTFVRTIRDRAVETGSTFGLTVARDRHDAIFFDAFFRFARADASDAALRSYVGFGLRALFKGWMPTAIGGYAGAPLTLIATGAQRADSGHGIGGPLLSLYQRARAVFRRPRPDRR